MIYKYDSKPGILCSQEIPETELYSLRKLLQKGVRVHAHGNGIVIMQFLSYSSFLHKYVKEIAKIRQIMSLDVIFHIKKVH